MTLPRFASDLAAEMPAVSVNIREHSQRGAGLSASRDAAKVAKWRKWKPPRFRSFPRDISSSGGRHGSESREVAYGQLRFQTGSLCGPPAGRFASLTEDRVLLRSLRPSARRFAISPS